MGTDLRTAARALGERLAAEHLVRRGFEIVERNFRTRWGELDIVAFDGRVLAFCEVKTRRHAARSGAARSTRSARSSAPRCARWPAVWLNARRDRPYAHELRFDAIGVTFDLSGRLLSIEHLEGAF